MPWQSTPLKRPFVRSRENPLPSLSLYRRNRAERGCFFFAWQEDGLLHRYTCYTATPATPATPFYVQGYRSTLSTRLHLAPPRLRFSCRMLIKHPLILL